MVVAGEHDRCAGWRGAGDGRRCRHGMGELTVAGRTSTGSVVAVVSGPKRTRSGDQPFSFQTSRAESASPLCQEFHTAAVRAVPKPAISLDSLQADL